jgi:hypothetical protein
VNKFQGILLGGLAILAIAVVLFSRTPSTTPAPASPQKLRTAQRNVNEVDPENRSLSRRRADVRFESFPEIPAPISSPHLAGTSENQQWIDERKENLNDLSWFDDAESLSKILAELQNPLPEIRTAALTAVRDFGSRDAVPYLEAAAIKTADPMEKKSLEELIEHLKLPTVIEHLEGNATESSTELE